MFCPAGGSFRCSPARGRFPTPSHHSKDCSASNFRTKNTDLQVLFQNLRIGPVRWKEAASAARRAFAPALQPWRSTDISRILSTAPFFCVSQPGVGERPRWHLPGLVWEEGRKEPNMAGLVRRSSPAFSPQTRGFSWTVLNVEIEI